MAGDASRRRAAIRVHLMENIRAPGGAAELGNRRDGAYGEAGLSRGSRDGATG